MKSEIRMDGVKATQTIDVGAVRKMMDDSALAEFLRQWEDSHPGYTVPPGEYPLRPGWKSWDAMTYLMWAERKMRVLDDDPVMVLRNEADPLTADIDWISNRASLEAAQCTSIDAESTPTFDVLEREWPYIVELGRMPS